MQEVAGNAETQSTSIVETSQVLVELSSLVQIAQNKSTSSKENSDRMSSVAHTGREKVLETVKAMELINSSSNETANILDLLEVLSKKVSGIISTINNISSQTNLLALNAAIEAARAGEHGRGFSVVADEVRKLSEETSIGSNEISGLVSEMVLEIEKAVKSMEIGNEAVKNGVIVVEETDKAFVDIISAIEVIAKDVEQIAEVTREEVASSEKIINLIDAVASSSETTASSSQQVAAATEEQSASIQNIASISEETSAMANSLSDLVDKFII